MLFPRSRNKICLPTNALSYNSHIGIVKQILLRLHREMQDAIFFGFGWTKRRNRTCLLDELTVTVEEILVEGKDVDLLPTGKDVTFVRDCGHHEVTAIIKHLSILKWHNFTGT